MIKMNARALIKIESSPGSDKFTKEISIQFNPTEISDSYSAEFKPGAENHNKDLYFRHTTRGDLTLNLSLDATQPVEVAGAMASIKDRLDELRGLIKPSATKNERQTPARIQFVWGDFVYIGYVKSLTEKRTLFNSDGQLLRADVTLVINGTFDKTLVGEFEPKTNSRKFHTTLASDRLDLLAQQYFGDARLWRPIAEENSIERPARFPDDHVGRVLAIPDLSPRELAKRMARLRNS